MTSTSDERYFALDGLRATMMLLGIVLHASVSYIVTVLPDNAWGYKDPNTTVVADFVLLGIHIFRMPIFFVMAGFFAALLMARYGVGGMLRNRASRVLVPFLVFWTLLSPLIILAAWFANGQAATGNGLQVIQANLGTAPLWMDSTLHLWFLYFLIWFYLAAALARPAVRALPSSWRAAGAAAFRSVMGWRVRALVFAVPTAVVLIPQGGSLQTANNFTPAVISLAGYLTFFGFGWAVFRHRDLVPTLTRDAWVQTILGAVLIPVSVLAQFRAGPDASLGPVLLASVLGASCVWFLIFGITGLFMRYLDRPIPRVRYLTDAAYWLYLIHLPFMFLVPGLLAPYNIPALIKIVIVLAVVTPITLVTYHYLVRATIIGVMLNGRRYPRQVPASVA